MGQPFTQAFATHTVAPWRNVEFEHGRFNTEKVMSDDEERLREHPRERFADPVRKLNLEEEFDNLLEEAHEPVDDHRQVTLVRRHGLSLILFYFEPGGFMPDHKVEGEVSIHVLEGELKVGAEGDVNHLTDDEILILAPGVEHDVEAVTETKMLLTIEAAERS